MIRVKSAGFTITYLPEPAPQPVIAKTLGIKVSSDNSVLMQRSVTFSLQSVPAPYSSIPVMVKGHGPVPAKSNFAVIHVTQPFVTTVNNLSFVFGSGRRANWKIDAGRRAR